MTIGFYLLSSSPLSEPSSSFTSLMATPQPVTGRERSAVSTAELTKAGDAVAAPTGGPTTIALHHHDITALQD